MLRFIAVGIALIMIPASLLAQGVEYLKAHYTKYEHRIPMRDGKRLFTSVYVPKDDAIKYPILLIRTPYSVGPYGVDKYPSDLRPSALFAKSGYIFAFQDVRGRWMSEGEFVNMRPHNPNKKDQEVDESSDTYDTIDWLVKNIPGNNGKVGQTGISYPGFYTVCGMIDAHPALVAVSPQAPVTDWFVGDDFHHNGAFFLPHFFNFFANFGRPAQPPFKKLPYQPFDHETPDGYSFFLELGPLSNIDEKHFKGNVSFWNEVKQHGNYDEFWKSRNIRAHIRNVKPAVMTVGGWFDAENLFGALETYKRVESSGASKNGNHLVMGPWVHGGWSREDGDKLGDISFNAKTAEYYREQIELPFFEYHLKGKGDLKHPKAWVFESGTNIWRKFATWPPTQAKQMNYYLREDGRLMNIPTESTAVQFDEFVSDPAKPVPFHNKTVIGMTYDYMTGDQRFAAQRPDVLVYQTPIMEKDVTIAGAIEVDLHVSTTGTDADWIVKMIDVFPGDYPDPNPNPTQVRMGGYQMLVRSDVMRGKFRDSFEKPKAFTPGEVTRVKFTLPDTLHTIRTGHRLMIQVQSTCFPLVDRNPQVFCDIYTAKSTDFRKQIHRVHRSANGASHIRLPIIP